MLFVMPSNKVKIPKSTILLLVQKQQLVTNASPQVAANALKQYLREMSPSLLGETEYNSVMQMNHLRTDLSESTMLQYLKAFIETLPAPTAVTVKSIFELLYRISVTPQSQMDSIALASVIAPLILRKPAVPVEKPLPEMGLDTLRRKYRYLG
jgi:hypothetical protein